MLEKASLFATKREAFFTLGLFAFILTYSLLIEFQNYKNLTRFDSAQTNATILKQYKKSKETKNGQLRNYHILKLKSDEGYTFYTNTKLSYPPSLGKKITIVFFAPEISFYEYLQSFYAPGYILETNETKTLKQKVNASIASAHTNAESTNIYQALYTATVLDKSLQSAFSNLGVSHLLAISGFHLGVLSAVLYFLLKFPYKYLQERYFPYRSQNRDLFVLVAIALFFYLLFLDSPASVLRAFGMLLVGFFLHDRGLKIVSMQTLLLSVLLLLAFFPRLFFALGFWLSVAGVFYIFLFLIYFQEMQKKWQFILLPLWVYGMMLPYSLVIFGIFSSYHPLSIIWTFLFTFFYPLSIFLHFVGFGDLFDTVLQLFIGLGQTHITLSINAAWLAFYVLLSVLAIFKRTVLKLLILLALAFFIYSVYHVT
ncbi:MAG: ComEC/Rec2 family competence protein [Sulfurimonas sp.]|jgi:competence protein ComEC|nr:ComEC/Rec2 family competence protein [Sulfurimonas sp.]MBU3939775.1 ComEC/Rec2 family competence protein [bacterium]MBU4024210.1 ComEC/Rec2 family competence protein [bacterium]MBU4058636.1 ComEC/Rec2 family competence protein [bacterium]